MKIRSNKSSIETVKRLFANNPNDDSISLVDAFRAWGRSNPEDIEIHKPWFSNAMTHLTYHNLVKSVYSYDGRRKLIGIELTIEGKRALGRIEGYVKQEEGVLERNTITILDVMKIVAKLRKDNPDYDITFDVKLKSDMR